MRRKTLKHFLPALAWMALIFYLSQQNGSQSSHLSSGLMKRLEGLTSYWGLGLEGQALHILVRKAGHFFAYFILAGLLTYGYQKSSRLRPGLILALVFLYACTDEFHQVFVPGRSGEFRDVLIDTSGGLCFLALYLGARGLYKHHKEKNAGT